MCYKHTLIYGIAGLCHIPPFAELDIIMKAISIPKNKYDAEEERLAKLKSSGRIITAKPSTDHSTNQSLQNAARPKRSGEDGMPVSESCSSSDNTKSVRYNDTPSSILHAFSSVSLEPSTATRVKKDVNLNPVAVSSNSGNHNDDDISGGDTVIQRQRSKRYSSIITISLLC